MGVSRKPVAAVGIHPKIGYIIVGSGIFGSLPSSMGAGVTLLLVEQAIILASGKEEGSDAEISL